MTTHDAHPTPECVFATDAGSPRCRRVVPIAQGLASRFDLPIRAVHLTDENRCPGGVDGLIESAMDHAALVLAAVPSTGRARRTARSVGRPLAIGSRLPWIAVGPGLRHAHRDGPEHLVVAVDESPDTAALVPTALSWGTMFGLVVHVIAVVPAGPQPLRTPTRPSPRQRFCANPDAHVQRLLEATPHADTRVKTDTVADPIGTASAMHHLLRHRRDAILVAPASRPRSASALVDQTSTNSMLRHSPVPVLLLPPRRDETGVDR